jgi:hypothetical protein
MVTKHRKINMFKKVTKHNVNFIPHFTAKNVRCALASSLTVFLKLTHEHLSAAVWK